MNQSFLILGVVASDLPGHAGKIQAALVIDFNHESFRGVDVQFEGINGLLPNLDLLHVVFHVTRTERVLAKLNNQVIVSTFSSTLELNLNIIDICDYEYLNVLLEILQNVMKGNE